MEGSKYGKSRRGTGVRYMLQYTLSTLHGACDDAHALFVFGDGMGLGELVADVLLAGYVDDAYVARADAVADPVVLYVDVLHSFHLGRHRPQPPVQGW